MNSPDKKFSFQRVSSGDAALHEVIADWYFEEWQIDREETRRRLSCLPDHGVPFHVVMFEHGQPVATGGVHHDVRLVQVEPRFAAHGPWLALVVTPPAHRRKGFGALLCARLAAMSAAEGLSELHLYTVTAESLYARLGWRVVERIHYVEKDCAVMKLRL